MLRHFRVLPKINWCVWVIFFFFLSGLLILWLFGDLGSLLMYVCQCFSPDAALRRRWSRHRASRSGFTLHVFASLTGLAETNKHHTPTLIPPFPSHKKKTILALPKHTRHYRLIWFFFSPSSLTSLLKFLTYLEAGSVQLNNWSSNTGQSKIELFCVSP